MKKNFPAISLSMIFLGAITGLFSIWSCNENPTAPIVSSWSSEIVDSNYSLNSITWADSQYVAVGTYDTNYSDGIILTSPNGVNWTKRFVLKGGQITYVTWVNNLLIAISSPYILISRDGISWTDTTINLAPNSITWSGSEFVGAGEDGITTSPDGRNWSENSFPIEVNSLTSNGGEIVAVGQASNDTSTAGSIATSVNGSNWKFTNINSVVELNSIVWTGKEFVAIGGNEILQFSSGYPNILTSTDGVTWNSKVLSTPGNPYSLIWTGSELVALVLSSAGFSVLTSTDAINWSFSNFTSNTFIKAIASSGSQLVGVGNNGTVMVSR